MIMPVSRRHLLRSSAGWGAAALIPCGFPSPSRAQAKTLVAATFPGTWNEAHREILAPAFTKRTGAAVDMNPSRDFWYHDAAKMVTTECPVEHMNAEDPLFILYTAPIRFRGSKRPKAADRRSTWRCSIRRRSLTQRSRE